MHIEPMDPQAVALTGIAEIDAQHARLVTLLNRLVTWCNQDMVVSATFDAVRELEEYARTHFQYEERYMRDHGYPAYEEHQLLHRDIERQFVKLTSKIYDGQDTAEELVEFVREWITSHIGVDDLGYGAYFKSKATAS